MRSASRTAATASGSPSSTRFVSHSTTVSPREESTRSFAIAQTSLPAGTGSRSGPAVQKPCHSRLGLAASLLDYIQYTPRPCDVKRSCAAGLTRWQRLTLPATDRILPYRRGSRRRTARRGRVVGIRGRAGRRGRDMGRLLLAIVLIMAGAQIALGSTWRVAAQDSGAQVVVERPLPGTSISVQADISGWAIDPTGPGTGIDAVHVYLDGEPGQPRARFLGQASYGQPRPDVARTLGDARYTNSGFALLSELPPGTHSLFVYAHTAGAGPQEGWNRASVASFETSLIEAAPTMVQAGPTPAGDSGRYQTGPASWQGGNTCVRYTGSGSCESSIPVGVATGASCIQWNQRGQCTNYVGGTDSAANSSPPPTPAVRSVPPSGPASVPTVTSGGAPRPPVGAPRAVAPPDAATGDDADGDATTPSSGPPHGALPAAAPPSVDTTGGDTTGGDATGGGASPPAQRPPVADAPARPAARGRRPRPRRRAGPQAAARAPCQRQSSSSFLPPLAACRPARATRRFRQTRRHRSPTRPWSRPRRPRYTRTTRRPVWRPSARAARYTSDAAGTARPAQPRARRPLPGRQCFRAPPAPSAPLGEGRPCSVPMWSPRPRPRRPRVRPSVAAAALGSATNPTRSRAAPMAPPAGTPTAPLTVGYRGLHTGHRRRWAAVGSPAPVSVVAGRSPPGFTSRGGPCWAASSSPAPGRDHER